MILVVAVVLFLEKRTDENDDSELDDIELEMRRAELANIIIDSSDDRPQIDSLTGFEVATSGSLITEALEQLRSPMTAPQGLSTLEKVAAKNYSSSAPAYSILGALSARASYMDSTMISSVESLIPNDFTQAHTYAEKAVELDPNDPVATFELACDCLAGDSRGVKSRDLEAAKQLLIKGYPNVKNHGNVALKKQYEKWLERLEVAFDSL